MARFGDRQLRRIADVEAIGEQIGEIELLPVGNRIQGSTLTRGSPPSVVPPPAVSVAVAVDVAAIGVAVRRCCECSSSSTDALARPKSPDAIFEPFGSPTRPESSSSSRLTLAPRDRNWLRRPCG